MHAAGTDGRDRGPGRVVIDLGGEVAVDGDDDIGIPHQHLLDPPETLPRPPRISPATFWARKLDDYFDRDRATQSGFEPARTAREIDARPLLLGNSQTIRRKYCCERVLGGSRRGLPRRRGGRSARRPAVSTAVAGNCRPAMHRECRSAAARGRRARHKFCRSRSRRREWDPAKMGLAASRLAVLPQPVMRPTSGRLPIVGRKQELPLIPAPLGRVQPSSSSGAKV